MQLERHHRKIILLGFAIKNLLPERHQKPPEQKDVNFPTQGRWVYEAGGGKNSVYCVTDKNGAGGFYSEISKSGLEAHLEGVGVKSPSLKKYDEFCSELFPEMGREHPMCISDPEKELGVFRFAEYLGLEASLARFVIDHHYAEVFPTFGTFAKIRNDTEEIAVNHGGVYSVYRHDMNPSTQALDNPLGIVCDCRLSIRYPVPYRKTKGGGKSLFRVRCKLNVPNYATLKNPTLPASEKFFRYDGFVSEKGDHWWQWLFQARRFSHENSEDLILMHCRKEETTVDGLSYRAGTITYQDQSSELRPRSSNILVVRHPGFSIEVADPPNSFAKALPKVKRFYQMSPGERTLMRDPRIINVHNRQSWTSVDEIALPILFGLSDDNI